MKQKPKMFTTGAIIEMIIAIFCIVGGSFIIIFNIIIYPKFNNLVYSVIGLFALVFVLLLIAANVVIRYKRVTTVDEVEEDGQNLDKENGKEILNDTDNKE